jgi:hypothetical protein
MQNLQECGGAGGLQELQRAGSVRVSFACQTVSPRWQHLHAFDPNTFAEIARAPLDATRFVRLSARRILAWHLRLAQRVARV